MFKAMFRVEYSHSGSVMRGSEEQTYIYFIDFLDECEGMVQLFTGFKYIIMCCRK